MYKCVHPSSISSLAMRRHCYTLRGSVLSFLGRSLLSFVSTVCQLCCFRCYASCRLHDRLCHTGFMLSRISSCWLSSVVWHFWYKSKYYTGMQPAVSTWLTAFQTFEYWMQNFVVTFFALWHLYPYWTCRRAVTIVNGSLLVHCCEQCPVCSWCHIHCDLWRCSVSGLLLVLYLRFILSCRPNCAWEWSELQWPDAEFCR